jgi:hypothetical protein
MTSFLKKECGVLLRNRWKRVLIRRPSVLDFLILALSKTVAEKKTHHLGSLIGHCNGSLVGLILMLDLKKIRYSSRCLIGPPCLVGIDQLCTRPVGQPRDSKAMSTGTIFFT